MKKLFTISASLLITMNVFCQQIYSIKESYDQILEPQYSAIDYNNNSTNWWQSWGWTLLSYLRMYQSTQDKAYLNKFIKHAYGIQVHRGSSPADWSAAINPDNQEMLYTGQLLRPMAEFVFIIKNNNILYNTNLISGLVPSVIGTQTILGYGDFANWLQGRVVETLDHYNSEFWINDDKCYNEAPLTNCEKNCANAGCSGIPCTFCSCPEPAVINFQSSFAAALFFIGYIDPINFSNYTHKAEQIVTFFRNRVTEFPPNQSYTWFHDDTFREDVAHGGIDIHIPLVAYLLYGNGLYQPSEMNKFANTFTYNIWDRNNQVFHNNVFGTDNGIDPAQSICGGTIPSNGTQNFYGPGEVLTWMPLYPFDDFSASPNDVYTVLVTQTVKLLTDDPTAFLPPGYCSSITHNLSGTQSFYGLSEVVKAQWDKECVNLTLYNRDVVYDQDFVVKNKLVVAPQQSDNNYQAGVDDPFAEPKTFADNGSKDRFVVEPGTTVNFVAGESIVFGPGTHLKAGSNVHAYIDPNICSDGMRIGNPSGSGKNQDNLTKSIVDTSYKDSSLSTLTLINKKENISSRDSSFLTFRSFIVYPNPTNGIVYIAFSLDNNSIVTLKITDIMGHEVFSEINHKQLSSGNYIIPFDGTSFSKGMYLCAFIVNGQPIKTEKIMLLK